MLKRIKKAIKIWKATKNEDSVLVDKTLDSLIGSGAFIPMPDEDEWEQIEKEREQRETLGNLYDKIKKML